MQRGRNADDTFIIATPEKINTGKSSNVSDSQCFAYTSAFHQFNIKYF
jgi:hypothetical protein